MLATVDRAPTDLLTVALTLAPLKGVATVATVEVSVAMATVGPRSAMVATVDTTSPGTRWGEVNGGQGKQHTFR